MSLVLIEGGGCSGLQKDSGFIKYPYGVQKVIE
jgi:hypothetical protein